MNKKQNIDKLFQDKFKDVEITPHISVWESIEADLKSKKKRPFYFLNWPKYAGVAMLFLLSGLFVLRNLNVNSNAKSTNLISLQQTDRVNNQKINKVVSLQKYIITEKSLKQTDTKNIVSTDFHGNEKEPAKDLNKQKLKAIVTSDNTINNRITESKIGDNKLAKNTLNHQNNTKYNIASDQHRTEILNDVKNNKLSAYVQPKNKNKIQNNALLKSDNYKNTVKNKTLINAQIKQFKLNIAENKEQKAVANDSIENNLTVGNASLKTIKGNKAFIEKQNPIAGKTSNLALIDNNSNVSRKAVVLKIDSLLYKIKLDSTKLAIVEINKLEKVLNGKELKKREQKINRWQITSNVAPIYFSSMANGSPLDTKFTDNQKAFYVSQSYGVGVSYGLNSKIKIRTGLNRISINYDTKDVAYAMNTTGAKLANLSLNSVGRSISIGNIKNVTVFGKSQNSSPADSDLGAIGSLNQKMGYFELPVEMSYKFGSKNFSIDLIAGLSTFFLQQNSVFLQTANSSIEIGEASNLNNFHFSGNIGFGINYKLLKNFDASIEPTFKYQINTFSRDAGNFQPYIFGLYSGLKYNF